MAEWILGKQNPRGASKSDWQASHYLVTCILMASYSTQAFSILQSVSKVNPLFEVLCVILVFFKKLLY